MMTRYVAGKGWPAVTLWIAVLLLICTTGSEGLAGSMTFRAWGDQCEREAVAAGVSPSLYREAFSGIDEPDRKALERAAYQPEFTLKIWEYLDTRVNRLSITRGAAMMARHGATLSRIDRDFGVPPPVVLAIWSMESNYGSVLEKKERLHYVPQALASLGWGDGKRQKFGKKQLIASLRILQAGDVRKDQLPGSWAGAMGHTQFIPTSYLAYGVDFDGDGRRDIWNSIPDALATAANLLKQNGWQPGKTWGYEVVLPAGAESYSGQTKTLAEWRRLGFHRPGDEAFPRPDDRAELKMLAGQDGPGFLMLKNFFVFKRYNNSDFYALAVGLLADRLVGAAGMVQEWPRPAGSLSFEENYELQRLLKEKGFYQGEIDGYIGKVTRQAIEEFQKQAGLAVDGMPGQALLNALKKH